MDSAVFCVYLKFHVVERAVWIEKERNAIESVSRMYTIKYICNKKIDLKLVIQMKIQF